MSLPQLSLLGTALVVVGALLCGGGAALSAPARMTDRRWQLDRLYYRHHRVGGLLLALGGMVFLLLLAITADQPARQGIWATPRGQLLADLVRVAGWCFAAIAVAIGVLTAHRPSLLKPIERRANRWIDIGLIARNPGIAPRAYPMTGLVLVLGGLALLWHAILG